MANSSKVYDFFCPSPLPLKTLASMEVAVYLWRREIQLHLAKDGTMNERYLRKKTSLRSLFAELRITSEVAPLIEEYVMLLESRIPDWLRYHIKRGIFKANILKQFSDFVCDYDGSIHYGKTAKRFVACKEIDAEARFRMACEYCLEYEILEVLPMIGRRMKVTSLNFDLQPKLYYWVCLIQDHYPELCQVGFEMLGKASAEDFVLHIVYRNEKFNPHEWPAVEHFLNRLCPEVRKWNLEMMAKLAFRLEPLYDPYLVTNFYRYVMTRLDERYVRDVMEITEEKLVIYAEPDYVLRVWQYLKDDFTADGFCALASHILRDQTDNPSPHDSSPAFDATPYWRELWISAPDRLKRVALRKVLPNIDRSIFDRLNFEGEERGRHLPPRARRSVSFISAMLSEAPITDRRAFWEKHWVKLIYDITPADLNLLLNLCYDDENQKTRFKNDLITEHYDAVVEPHLKRVLEGGCLQELEEFLTLCQPSEENIKSIRLQLLQSDSFTTCCGSIRDARSLSEYIDRAFEDPALSADFKNNLLASPSSKLISELKHCFERRGFRYLMDFVEILASSEEIKEQFKKLHLMPELVSEFLSTIYFLCLFDSNYEEFESFIGWLCKTPNEIEQFKRALDVNAVIKHLLKDKKDSVVNGKKNNVDRDCFENCFQTLDMHDSFLVKFLNWYFVTPGALKKFEKKYARDPIFKRLLR